MKCYLYGVGYATHIKLLTLVVRSYTHVLIVSCLPAGSEAQEYENAGK